MTIRPRPPTHKRTRLSATQLLVLILYGTYPFMTESADGTITLRIGPLARAVSRTNGRVRDSIQWLADCGYLTDLTWRYNEATFRIAPPLRPLVQG